MGQGPTCAYPPQTEPRVATWQQSVSHAMVGGLSAEADTLCPQHNLLLALGIISAPDYHGRRMAQRHSWMRWPMASRHSASATICANFVVRAGRAPIGVARALRREAATHVDTLLVRDIDME